MKLFIAISALLAWLFGGLLMFFPGEFYGPTGITITPLLATIAQAHGATLIGLGVVNWIAKDADRRGLTAVLGGNLVVQIFSLFVAFRTIALGAGAAGIPGVIIHVVMGAFFVFFLLRARAK